MRARSGWWLRSSLVVAGLLAGACAPAYREDGRPRGRATAADSGLTVVGHVTPSGELVADTLASDLPDTAGVQRETVMTGAVRPRLDPDGPALATGFRVQVLATPDRAIAERYARGLETVVGGEPVYVEWVDPWWKVRVGDFAIRQAAERLRTRLVSEGIAEAWTVETTIRTAP